MTATDRARFFAGEYPRKPRRRIRYRAFWQDRPCIFKTTRGWITVTGNAVRTASEPYATYAEAVTAMFPPTWTSDYEPDYSTIVRAIQDGAS